MTPQAAIGIDLGGTNLKAAVVDSDGRILGKQTVPIDAARGAQTCVAEMASLIDGLLGDLSLRRSDVVGVGVGAPGPFSYRDGRIIRAANLPGWENVPLRDWLHERLQLPVIMDNDGNTAAFGEFWVGAGRGADDLVMLTLGTGVGAGVVIDGRILHGHFDNAAELGHMIVALDGLACRCGQRGCLEQYASAGTVARRVVEAIKSGEPSTLADTVRAGKPINAKHVADCAKAGDALCLRIWDEACRYLAIACINIQHAYNPARVVLGGGMSEAGSFLLDRVTAHVSNQRWSLHDDLPEVSLARLGYDAGVIGAAGLLWREKYGQAE